MQGVSNNYDTDLILPIVLEAAKLAGIDYHSADAATRTALRVLPKPFPCTSPSPLLSKTSSLMVQAEHDRRKGM